MLTPTTLLVSQHLETLQNRFAIFPITAVALSRFATIKETTRIKTDLADGKIEVAAGTRVLLLGKVRFKDLGLVVIGEKQCFGMEHKEALKTPHINVDVLAMSTTPISRTLGMAITGTRGLLTLTTPPEKRHPVLIYVGTRSDRQVMAAVRREMLRNGQVFCVHNRVQSIARVTKHLQPPVSEARIRIGHSQIPETQLERVMMDFQNQELDVLVPTTIVENGPDVTNANTIIIDRAEQMGLSQPYQLRGHVGRGREHGYAYFLCPGGDTLSETASERLKTIGSNTSLGAGMATAQKDLEIRGAGNLFGDEQSGHIVSIGFDLYVHMVGEVVAAYNEEGPAEDTAMNLEIPVDAYIPEDYPETQSLHFDAYTRLSSATLDEEIDQPFNGMGDRYERLPNSVQRLGELAKLQNLMRKYGLRKIGVRGKFIRFTSVELTDSQLARLKRLHPGAIIKLATRELFIPKPVEYEGLSEAPVIGVELVDWVSGVISAIIKPF